MPEPMDPKHIGTKFPPFSFKVEQGKIREFALAIGDDNPAYFADDPAEVSMPPTFPTTFTFWGAEGKLWTNLESIGVSLLHILHAEQEFEYLAPIHPGDTINGQAVVKDIYEKKGRGFMLDFVAIEFNYTNQNDEPVLRVVETIVVRREI